MFHYNWQVALGCSRVRFVDTIVRLSKLVWLTLNVWAKFVNVDGMSGFPFYFLVMTLSPFIPFLQTRVQKVFVWKWLLNKYRLNACVVCAMYFYLPDFSPFFPNHSWSTDYTRFPCEILTNDPKLICCWGKSPIYHFYTRNDRTGDILLRDS